VPAPRSGRVRRPRVGGGHAARARRQAGLRREPYAGLGEAAERVADRGSAARRTRSGGRHVHGSAAAEDDHDERKQGSRPRPCLASTMPSCSSRLSAVLWPVLLWPVSVSPAWASPGLAASLVASIRDGIPSLVFPEMHVCSLEKKLLAQSPACSCSQGIKLGGLVVGRLGINMQRVYINMQHAELFAQATSSGHLDEYGTHNV
jgi:hypothetical protein